MDKLHTIEVSGNRVFKISTVLLNSLKFCHNQNEKSINRKISKPNCNSILYSLLYLKYSSHNSDKLLRIQLNTEEVKVSNYPVYANDNRYQLQHVVPSIILRILPIMMLCIFTFTKISLIHRESLFEKGWK